MVFVNEIEFDQSYSFIYSARPGTPAASMDDPTPLDVKKDRLNRLQDALKANTHKFSMAMLGTTQRVLVDGYSKKSPKVLSGRTENNRVCNFIGPEQLIGQMADVVITEVLPNSLKGRYILDDAPNNQIDTSAREMIS